jgi:anti-sigma regulatory factor (Ser/Thr protein kinase)
MGSPKRILILDGDPQTQHGLRESLGTPDREFHTAPPDAGPVAIAPYDLILAGTLSALTCVRGIWPKTPVIVIAESAGPDDVLSAVQAQAYAFFRVPYVVSALSATVELALESAWDEGDIQVHSARPNWFGAELRCKRETADRVLQFVRELVADLGSPHQENFATALREILANAIEHGGGLDPLKTVSIASVRTRHAVLCYVRDPGKGFCFDQLPHAAVSNPVETPFEHAEVRQRLGMRPGGFGILLARSLVDELIYDQAGNEVLLVKYVAQ